MSADTPRLDLDRQRILAFRRRVSALDAQLPAGTESLRTAAWAGLQDSMPRAALLSIHARVAGTQPSTWEDPALAQVWGPRFSAYVIAAQDRAAFTLGRLSDDPAKRRYAEEMAARLHEFLAGRRMSYSEAGHALGVAPNALRYAAPTGTVLMRWEGARRPIVWTVPRPDIEPSAARLDLARRYLHVFGPSTPAAFAGWAGIRFRRGSDPFDGIRRELTPVRTPIGDAWILSADEPAFRAPPRPAAAARLLPSGDIYFLLWGADRALLVEDANERSQLWTSRVWPGAVLVEGEVVGTWRRADSALTVDPWRPLAPAEREAIESEAAALPLPGLMAPISVRWTG